MMDWLIPLLAVSGFFILWVFVLSRFDEKSARKEAADVH